MGWSPIAFLINMIFQILSFFVIFQFISCESISKYFQNNSQKTYNNDKKSFILEETTNSDKKKNYRSI